MIFASFDFDNRPALHHFLTLRRRDVSGEEQSSPRCGAPARGRALLLRHDIKEAETQKWSTDVNLRRQVLQRLPRFQSPWDFAQRGLGCYPGRRAWERQAFTDRGIKA